MKFLWGPYIFFLPGAHSMLKPALIVYIYTRSIVRSDDGDTEFITITGGVLQGDTLAPFLFIICLENVT